MKDLAPLLRRLRRPSGRVDVVLDTDAYNEIDDQFAIAYLLRAGERAAIQAFYAAPFYNERSAGPADGMERSYREILHLLRLADREDLASVTLRGSGRYLPDERTPVDSPAARDLVRRAAAHTPEAPLYVLAIGAITNVASALLLDPSIAGSIVIVWLGGHALHWPDTREFNMCQDVAAARVVFGSGAALVQLPCMGVVDQLRTTEPELIRWLRGRNALCDYLVDNTVAEAERYAAGKPWSRVIWDISVVAWLLDESGSWMRDEVIPAPIPQYDHHYSFDPRRHPICCVRAIDRDAVFEDLFRRLAQS